MLKNFKLKTPKFLIKLHEIIYIYFNIPSKTRKNHKFYMISLIRFKCKKCNLIITEIDNDRWVNNSDMKNNPSCEEILMDNTLK